MQSRYGAGNYGYNLGSFFKKAEDRKAKYFNLDGSIYISGDFSPVVQFYFVMPDYINVAGGYARQYTRKLGGLFGAIINVFYDYGIDQYREYNVQSRPNTIITKGYDSMTKSCESDDPNMEESIDTLEKEMITMRGEKEFFSSKNLATYKSCTFGYFKDGGKSRHLAWPQNSNSNNHNDNRIKIEDLLPKSWRPFARVDFAIERAAFRIYDFTNKDGIEHPLAGYYVLVARMSQNHNRGQYREYSRGLYEVVPGHKYKMVNDLKNYVIGNNKGSWLDNSGDWIYCLASTGEIVQVYVKFGSSADGSCHTFQKMWDADGNEMDVTKYQVNHCSTDSMKNDGGLIDVWEVDKDYKFTGRKFASSIGDGRIVISNPYLQGGSQTLVIDSRDYKNPSNKGATRSSVHDFMNWQDRTYNKGALDIACGGGQSVYIVGPEDYPLYGSFIYKLEGEKWAKTFGQGMRIAVDKSGEPWVVNREGDVWQSINGVWQDRGKELAADIAIGGFSSSLDTACIAGKDGRVYCSKGGSSWTLQRRLEKALRVGVDMRGLAWAIAGDVPVVYQQWKVFGFKFWRQVRGHPEPANDLAVGPDGRVMITAGMKTEGSGYEIYEWISGTTWKKVNGQQANEISLCGEDIWVTQANKAVVVGTLA